MNAVVKIQGIESDSYFNNALYSSLHAYLDEREALLFDDIEIDIEILREVTALYRVLLRLCTDDGVKPMPQVLKRIIYLKRDIYQQHRKSLQRKKYTSRVYLTNPANFR